MMETKQPEIEKTVEEKQEDKTENIEIPPELLKNPYKYICNFYEEVLPHTGKKCFEIISLMPCSLILPDISYRGTKIRSNINVLLLSSPGGGKSSISKSLSSIGYNVISIRSITPAELEQKIYHSPLFTLIVEDFATMSMDPIIMKIIEGILGEEKRVQRSTTRKNIDIETDGVGLLCGVPQDLSEYLSSGLVFRIIPICIFHSIEEHSEIGKKIVSGISEEDDKYEEKEKLIKKYYQDLFEIQLGKNKKISRIKGYYISDRFKEKAFNDWDKITKWIYEDTKASFNWFRSLHEFFRILISHAFLNVYNREIKNGMLYPNEEDYNVAIKIMKEDLRVKYRLLSTQSFLRNINNMKELEEKLRFNKFSDEQRKMIENLAKIKNRRVLT